MTFWAWLFALLFVVAVGYLVMGRLESSRLVKKMIEENVVLRKAQAELQERIETLSKQKNTLITFVACFVTQDSVSDILRGRAKCLDDVCKSAVDNQRRTEDPDEIQDVLTDACRLVAFEKEEFWNLVNIIKDANQVLRGIRQFQVPVSYKDALKGKT